MSDSTHNRHRGHADAGPAHTVRHILSQLINGMAIPTFVVNMSHVVTHWNPACEKLTGIPAGAMRGTCDAWKAFYTTVRPVLADLIVDGADEPGIARYYGGRYVKSELVEDAYEAQDFFPHLGVGGKWLYFTATPLKDDDGNIVGAIETFQDVTELRRAEAVLRENEEKLRQITASAQDAIVMMDERGRITFWNESAEKTFGYSADEILGQALHTILAPAQFHDRSAASLRNFRQTGRGPNLNRTTELSAVRKDGTEFPIELSLSAVKIQQRWHAIGIVRDITERKQAEETRREMNRHLQQSQKMAAIGTLAGGIAHDFNNILSGILGYAELALADLPPDSSLRHKLEGIRSSGDRARELVAQILSFSRTDDHVMSPVALHLLIDDALKLLRPAIPSTVDIRTEITAACHVMGDPSRLHRVIMNLCTNAYQAMAAGGTMTIALSTAVLSGEHAAAAQVPEGRYAKLVVSDAGAGIPPDGLDRIFEPYYTTKEKGKGTGLGLATVHGIVTSHEGGIRVESRVGKGTTFEVFLPLTQEGVAEAPAPPAPLPTGSEHILLVDDEPDILDIEKQMLKMLGYAVTAARSADAALSAFEAAPRRFALIITDMTMPGMTGDRLIAALRQHRPDLPALLCTGFSQNMSKEKAAALGIDGFLMKPVTMADLSKTVRDLLDDDTNPQPEPAGEGP